MTESFDPVAGEHNGTSEALGSICLEMICAESAIDHENHERGAAREQLSAAATLLEEAVDARSGLVSAVADLRQRLHVSEGHAEVEAEISASLTETLLSERVRAMLTESRLAQATAETEELLGKLNEERACVARLLSALVYALRTGQELAAELEGIKASRMYRLRYRFSRESTDDGVLAQYLSGLDTSLVTNLIASGSFDSAWYTATNLDVAHSGVDPIHHFFTQGWREGRSPSPGYDRDDVLALIHPSESQESSPLRKDLAGSGHQEGPT